MSKPLCIHTHDCSCVDVAEHSKLVKLYGDSERERGALLAEVERLKKDHAAELVYAIHQTEKRCLAEGERHAMERVRKVVGNPNPKIRAAAVSVEWKLAERKRIYDELGLGEEEK